jgi:Flp pilus assembly protein CpaB
MGESLNPSALSRVAEALRPDWTRTVVARRVAAGALVVLAAVAAVRSDPRGEQTDIVVAARDLSPGIELTAADVRLETRMAATVPDGSQTNLGEVVGSTLAGPARRGEVLTDVRLLGPRLAESVAGSDARIVPLHLAESALLDFVRPGDVVDVLVAPDAEGETDPQVVATDAVVVLVSEKQNGPGAGGDRVVLIALPAHAANDVAGAALTQTVTLTFH